MKALRPSRFVGIMVVTSSVCVHLLSSAAVAGARATPHAREVPSALSKDPCESYPGERLYAGALYEENTGEIQVFRADSKDAAPLCTFTSTNMYGIGGTALDNRNNLWVLSAGSKFLGLLVYQHGANGNVSPMQTISGSNTLIRSYNGYWQGLGRDADGNIWVPNGTPDGGGGYLTGYSDTANGNVAPVATIGVGDFGQAEGLDQPIGIAFDKAGNMFVINLNGPPPTLVVFKPPFTDKSTPIATWNIYGNREFEDANYIAFDDQGNLYVAGQFTLEMFANGLASGGAPSLAFELPFPNDVWGLAMDHHGNVFVADQETLSVAVLPPASKRWNVIRNISLAPLGPLTLVTGP